MQKKTLKKISGILGAFEFMGERVNILPVGIIGIVSAISVWYTLTFIDNKLNRSVELNYDDGPHVAVCINNPIVTKYLDEKENETQMIEAFKKLAPQDQIKAKEYIQKMVADSQKKAPKESTPKEEK